MSKLNGNLSIFNQLKPEDFAKFLPKMQNEDLYQ